ncbi:hypothetical protein [Candidatus Leptofilum sp.]|uniref:hypothetical protein n=1 Tax=Candidatus Leptofilum sp. TaxID=3241576 RepID=UPI003B5A2736
MSLSSLIWQTFLFFLTFWLGCYLIARDTSRLQLWLAGAGMLAFAAGIVTTLLGTFAPSASLALTLYRLQRLFVVLPALFWLAAMVWLIPNREAWVARYGRQQLLLGLSLACILAYGIAIGMIIIPGSQTIPTWLATVIGLDLFIFGLVIIQLDASDKGEAWFYHFLRALDYSFFTALIFGVQIILVMHFWIGLNFPLVGLLLTSVAASVLIQTFSDPVQSLIDRIAFVNAPALRQSRAAQRVEDDVAQRLETAQNPLDLPPAEFERLTRRALSQMGNLPKLASSPLTRLPLVSNRLSQNGRADGTLARAAELKTLLTESIAKLQPRDGGEFGTTDAWRHYNALYFPYVVGLRPYSRRTIQNEEYQEVLDWFRRQVPERTLYNWQTAAARLVARDLRERSRRLSQPPPPE